HRWRWCALRLRRRADVESSASSQNSCRGVRRGRLRRRRRCCVRERRRSSRFAGGGPARPNYRHSQREIRSCRDWHSRKGGCMTSQVSDQKIDNAQAYMDAVAEVARVAGDVAKSYFGKNPETRTKADGSPVSVADISAERAAREWIERRFPDDGILGEELPVARPEATLRWI